MQNRKIQDLIRSFQVAFPLTLPVAAGFFVLGVAYGILMNNVGLGIGWTFLMSCLIFAGSMQYAAIPLFMAPFNPLNAFMITLAVNARHIFYGLSMLERINASGKYKPYIIFGLCDEAFSIHNSYTPPTDIDSGLFMAVITFMVRWYWILPSLGGVLLGKILTFSLEGLEFALPALFIVIFLNQWKEGQNRLSLILGTGISIFSLMLFGAEGFLIPAMVTILTILVFIPLRPKVGATKDGNCS